MNAITNETQRASMSRNQYRGMEDHSAGGWNVYLGDAGMVLMGLPEKWAGKAVRLLNGCATPGEQRATLVRIREGIESRA